MTMHSSHGRAHGKIILSGEHAVLYGSHALLAPIDRFCSCTIKKKTSTQHYDILFKLDGQAYHLTWTAIFKNAKQIENAHHAYLKSSLSTTSICQSPLDFLSIALKKITDAFPEIADDCYDMTFISNIHMKVGLGSSAAITSALLHALIQLHQIKISKADFYQLARLIESYQHGKSSGMDIAACNHHQAIIFKNHQATEYPLADNLPFRFINTGIAQDSTGQAIAHAAKHWKDNYLDAFKQVTNTMIKALSNQAIDQIHLAIRKNHRLLCALGIVPGPIQAYVDTLESQGLSAKICGSGSSTGSSAGLLLLFGLDENSPLVLPSTYHLEAFKILNPYRLPY